MSSFNLTKRYADCVSEDGHAAILYHASLCIAGVPLHYESLLTKSHGSPAQVRSSVRLQSRISLQESYLGWKSGAWEASGMWKDFSSGVRETLYTEANNSLEWNCFAPRASASVRIGQQCIEGWGYAECIRLSIPPWRLPIRTLRWGRFVNAQDSFTWIEWSGPSQKQVIYLNGVASVAASITDDCVALGHGQGELHLDQKEVIREGHLGATALTLFAKTGLFPDSVLNMHEQKWLTSAVFKRSGRPDSVGWAIHEVVEWP